MLRADVADLVAQHGRELRLVLYVGQDAARDVDVAALGRKGVDVVGVDDREMPLEFRARGVRGEFLADMLHVLLQLQVVVHAHRLGDLEVHRLRLAHLATRLLRLLDLGFFGLGRRRRLGLLGCGRETGPAALATKSAMAQKAQQLARQFRHAMSPDPA